MGLRNRSLLNDESCFFVTTTCKNWLNLLAIGESMQLIGESLLFCNKKYKSMVLGYVIMPNHLHLVLAFTEKNHLSAYMRDFKKFTSVMIRTEIEKYTPELVELLRIQKKNRVFQVWQDRFDDVVLKSRNQLEVKLDYIHNNPLQEKWKLADTPEEYVFSSAGFYLDGTPDMFGLVTDYMEFV